MTITANGLSVQTGIRYYVSVRAVDNAGNTSAIASSDGQLVSPALSFGVSPDRLDLDGGNGGATGSVTLTASTNASAGYTARLYATQVLRAGSGALLGASFTGSWASPLPWSGAGLGYTSSDTSLGGSDRFAGATKYALVPVGGPGDAVADSTGPVSNNTVTVMASVSAAASQSPGVYMTALVFAGTAKY